MPMATAVWLVENTSLTFKQISEFCKLHEVEIQGIADGEVAKGIVGNNPIISGQLTKDEVELSSSDPNRPLNLKINEIKMSDKQKSFWLSSKHIVSSILKNEFNYKFIHPDYKSGLKAIWKMKN